MQSLPSRQGPLVSRIWILSIQTPRPLPHVATQLLDPIGAGTTGKTTHGIGGIDAGIVIIRAIGVRCVPPWINPPIVPPSRLLPLCLTRQRHLPALPAQQACQWVGGCFPG